MLGTYNRRIKFGQKCRTVWKKYQKTSGKFSNYTEKRRGGVSGVRGMMVLYIGRT